MTPKRGLWLRRLSENAPRTHHFRSMAHATLGLVGWLATILLPGSVWGQCAEIGPFQNYNGGGQVGCPCFITGEQAGVILDVPPGDYPIEILKIGIGWGSIFGGAPQSLEQAIHIYEGTLPNPGAPTYSLEGPVLTDGAINEFNIAFTLGDRTIDSGPFMVTLEFLNANSGNPYLPSVFHDGNGCQGGKNVVFAIPGGWSDACALGVTGDWVFYVKYRSLRPDAATNPSEIQFAGVPGNQTTCSTAYIRNDGCDTLLIDAINGCSGSPFAIDTSLTSHSIPPGDSTAVTVCVTPTTSNPDTCGLVISTNDGEQTVDVFVGGVVTGIIPGVVLSADGVTVFPNPFNPSTTIRFTLPEPAAVTAEIYRVDGTRIRVLEQEQGFASGENVVTWDGRDDHGDALSSGVYWVRVTSRFGTQIARAVLLK